MSFWADGSVKDETSATGVVTRTGYDAAGRAVTVTVGYGTADAATTTTEYDAADNVTAVTDPLGMRTEFAYDALGRLLSKTEAAGTALARTTTWVYDAMGQPTQSTDTMGKTTSWIYDKAGNVLTRTEGYAGNPSVRTWTYAYDTAGRQTSSTDPLGLVEAMSFRDDGTPNAGQRGAVSTVFLPGVTSDKRTDDLKTQRPDGKWMETFTDHDLAGRAWRVREPGVDAQYGAGGTGIEPERDTTQVRDLMGNVILEIGPGAGQATKYDYDADGRLIRTSVLADAAGLGTYIVQETAYDALGNVASVTDKSGRTTYYDYDGQGRRTAVREPLGKTTALAYDKLGRVVSVTDPMGVVTTNEYDLLGRLWRVTEAAGTGLARSTTKAYDGGDRVLSTTGPTGMQESATFDPLGRRQTSTNGLLGTTVCTNDPMGNPLTSTDPSGSVVASAYDVYGRLVTETAGASLPVSQQTVRQMAYDWAGRQASVSVNGSVVEARSFDRWGDEIATLDQKGGRSRRFDAAGGLAEIGPTSDEPPPQGVPPQQRTCYTHDLANRALSATDALGWTTTFAYGPGDALASMTDRDGRTRYFTTDALGRITQESAYAADGMPLGTVSSTRDLVGRLLSVTSAAGTVSQSYDALGRMVSTTDVFGITRTSTFDLADQRTSLIDTRGLDEAPGTAAPAAAAASPPTSPTSPPPTASTRAACRTWPVRLVVEDGMPYRDASWHLWRDHRVFAPYATIQNWVEAAGEKMPAGHGRRVPRQGAGPLLGLPGHRRGL
ncbi:MAG: hypothetical protein K2W96_13745 [Gemmataceae bacterium]|nr:hypothetical protein [Gemmataceae bacterium]